MKAKLLVLPLLAAMAWAATWAGPAWAHGGEEELPAMDNFAIAMSLLQVQPDMTDMIEDKLTDGLAAADVEGVDLGLARQAKEAFDAGNDAQALDLLVQATGMTPAEALAAQTDEGIRPSEVPLADQLGSPGSVGRPNAAATTALALGAFILIGLGMLLARRTR
jgi:hypothetical protein